MQRWNRNWHRQKGLRAEQVLANRATHDFFYTKWGPTPLVCSYVAAKDKLPNALLTQKTCNKQLTVKLWLGTLRQIKNHVIKRVLWKWLNSLHQTLWGTKQGVSSVSRWVWRDLQRCLKLWRSGWSESLLPHFRAKDGRSEGVQQSCWQACLCKNSAGGRQLLRNGHRPHRRLLPVLHS